jgi:hypothetical protein
MDTAVIAIGRNVGDQALSDERWQAFINDTVEVIRKFKGTIYTAAQGSGVWIGLTEDSRLFVFGAQSIEPILRRLPELARSYEQETIALITGSCHLVAAL